MTASGSGDAGYRETPPEPRCPRCRQTDQVTTGEPPWPYWCNRCQAVFSGSRIEAQDHAARIAAKQAEAMAARAALDRARAQRGEL